MITNHSDQILLSDGNKAQVLSAKKKLAGVKSFILETEVTPSDVTVLFTMVLLTAYANNQTFTIYDYRLLHDIDNN